MNETSRYFTHQYIWFQMTLALNFSRLYYALSVHYIDLTSHGPDDLRKKFQKSICFALLY